MPSFEKCSIRRSKSGNGYILTTPPHTNDLAEGIIALLSSVIASYPYTHTYQVWPSPNSNTFTAYVRQCLPQPRLVLLSGAT
jgi:hypothetical protein